MVLPGGARLKMGLDDQYTDADSDGLTDQHDTTAARDRLAEAQTPPGPHRRPIRVATATYWRPLRVRYVIGLPLVRSSVATRANSFPVRLSNAYRYGSPPPIRIRPFCVTSRPAAAGRAQAVRELDALQQRMRRIAGAAFAERDLPRDLAAVEIDRHEIRIGRLDHGIGPSLFERRRGAAAGPAPAR